MCWFPLLLTASWFKEEQFNLRPLVLWYLLCVVLPVSEYVILWDKRWIFLHVGCGRQRSVGWEGAQRGEVPRSVELLGKVRGLGAGIQCAGRLMLYKHEIGKIVKAVKEITTIEYEGKQECNLFLWQVKWTRARVMVKWVILCAAASLSHFHFPGKGLAPDGRFPQLLCSSSVRQSQWIHLILCPLTCSRICTSFSPIPCCLL